MTEDTATLDVLRDLIKGLREENTDAHDDIKSRLGRFEEQTEKDVDQLEGRVRSLEGKAQHVFGFAAGVSLAVSLIWKALTALVTKKL